MYAALVASIKQFNKLYPISYTILQAERTRDSLRTQDEGEEKLVKFMNIVNNY